MIGQFTMTLAKRFTGKWQEGNVPRAFNRASQLALVFCASASLPSRSDFSIFRNESS
jgi:hypothetical protein